MSSWHLVLDNLRFHWRSHIGVFLGVTVGAAVLVGALLVGDSVRHTLRAIALTRIGNVDLALLSGNRFFRAELADRVSESLPGRVAPVLSLRGSAANSDSSIRANQVHVYGVDNRFWEHGSGSQPAETKEESFLAINSRLAGRLDVSPGDDLIVLIEKPSLLSRDAPLSTDEDTAVSVRMRVDVIVPDDAMGRFSLRVQQVSPLNIFLPLDSLQRRIDLDGRANLMLATDTLGNKSFRELADKAVQENWGLSDAELEIRLLHEGKTLELRTNRIFLDRVAATVALNAGSQGDKILTYFVNEIRHQDRVTPYSVVSAMSPLRNSTQATGPEAETGTITEGLGDHEILVNDWLAEDLEIEPGSEVEMTYFVLGPMRKFVEKSRRFVVKEVLPLEGPAGDPTFMPEFPGLSEFEDCRDWEPGVPVQLDLIRDKDEEYWDSYSGTPKAFISLVAGQEMWGNSFGNLTSVRYRGEDPDRLTKRIRGGINPAALGLFFRPVREQALAASSQATDFGPLFLGLSFFLIVSALLLVSLLFLFGVESRSEEIGTLLAVGWHPKQVRGILMGEGLALALAGTICGTGLGLLYTKLILLGLSTVWGGAVAGTELRFHANLSSLWIGGLASILMSVLSLGLAIRNQGVYPVRDLLAGLTSFGSKPMNEEEASSKTTFWVGAVGLFVALALILHVETESAAATAGVFFAGGGLLLISALAFCRAGLFKLKTSTSSGALSLPGLSLRNLSRRHVRSLASIALLACGSFLVVAVGANRKDASIDSNARSSGTGGFNLVAESTFPIHHDLNTQEGLDQFGLSRAELSDVSFVPFRVREGDDASCLNLNRAQTPRLLGVEQEYLGKRRAFTFASNIGEEELEDPWSILERDTGDGTVPGVADQTTIKWALGKSLGDTITYLDDSGNMFHVKLVGALNSSVLQGNLLISEKVFKSRFPSESGYSFFLIDTPEGVAGKMAQKLSRSLNNLGVEIASTVDRLTEFNSVENTYLSIFQALGGLGMILGTIGLGIVVLRNVLDRRSELAVLSAVGFRFRAIRNLILGEHWALLCLGLFCGTTAGVIAVWPSLASGGATVPYLSLGATLITLIISGLFWTWVATRLALRGSLLGALRQE